MAHRECFWIRHWAALLVVASIGWSLSLGSGPPAAQRHSAERHRRLIPYMTYYMAQGLTQQRPAALQHNALEPSSPSRVRGSYLLVRPPAAPAAPPTSPPRAVFRFDQGARPSPPGPGPGYVKEQQFHPSPPLNPQDSDDYFKPVLASTAGLYRPSHLVIFPEDDTRIRAKQRQQQQQRKQQQQQQLLQQQLDEAYQVKQQQQLLKLLVLQQQVQQAKEIRAQLQAQRLRELLRVQQMQQVQQAQQEQEMRAHLQVQQQAMRAREQQELQAHLQVLRAQQVKQQDQELQGLRAQQEEELRAQHEAGLRVRAQQEEGLRVRAQQQEGLRVRAQQQEGLRVRAQQEEESRVRAQQEEESRVNAQQEERLRAQQEEGLRAQQEEGLRAQQEEGLRAQQEEGLRVQEEGLRAQQEVGLRAQQEEGLRVQQEEGLRSQHLNEVRAQQVDAEVEQQVVVSLEDVEKAAPTAASPSPPPRSPSHAPVVYAEDTETAPESVAPPSSSRELVAHLINGLQLSNKLPQSLTPDNFDMSLKTILQLLKVLHKSKTANGQGATPTRVKVSPEAPERDTAFYIGAGTVSQTFPAPSIEGSTPGRPGVDYPAYDSIPHTSFSCATQRYKGFFGDPDTNCQVWHYCDLNGGQASFLCPNGTIFSQVGLTCDWWFNVRCASTAQLYVLNERLYKYILPVKPSFPEDYSGPDVDRYLTEKFREMQAKARGRKEKLKQKESNGSSIPSAEGDTVGPVETNQTEEQEVQTHKPSVDANSKETDVQQQLDPDL